MNLLGNDASQTPSVCTSIIYLVVIKVVHVVQDSKN